jgi:hypothetical protein
VIFRFIDEHKDHWPVPLLCDALDVSPAGHYAWRDRPASARQQRRDALLVEIRAIHAEFKARYGGTPRWGTSPRRSTNGKIVNPLSTFRGELQQLRSHDRAGAVQLEGGFPSIGGIVKFRLGAGEIGSIGGGTHKSAP